MRSKIYKEFPQKYITYVNTKLKLALKQKRYTDMLKVGAWQQLKGWVTMF